MIFFMQVGGVFQRSKERDDIIISGLLFYTPLSNQVTNARSSTMSEAE